ncbi:MAG: RNA methyltransferase [Legionellales bacterium]|nr:RNA methyltransferase [Legionellales bacterium]
MTFESKRIILVATSHPGNIGSAARAMKTMGLTRLYLVKPRSFPDRWANELAAGADDVLDNAVVTESLADALIGCQLVYATSARSREIALPVLTPSEAAHEVGLVAEDTEVAFVFGREHAGLTNDELLHCHAHVTIPSEAAFSSLNLAQAVQIIAYELRMRWLSTQAILPEVMPDLATIEQMEQFYVHLKHVLLDIDFLKPSNPKKLLLRLRKLFNRTRLESVEINMLRGILTNVEQAIHKRSRATDG